MKGRLYLLIVITLIFTGCQTDQTKKNSTPAEDWEVNEQIINSHNTFGLNLFQSIVEVEANENIFISPTSVFVALSMLSNGADGMTRGEIFETLHLENFDEEDLNKTNLALLSLLNKETDDITVKLANSLWINDDFEFQTGFEERMDKYFQAKIEAIDALDQKAVEEINDWVSQATNEKIKDMIQFLPPNFVALLMNAIYLDAAWTLPFDENLTEEKPFYISEDFAINVPLMFNRDHFNYLETDEFQAVQLPYGEEASMQMTILLPKEDSTVKELIELLSINKLEKWQKDFSEQEGTILLPKFTLEYETILNDYLSDLGMSSAFNEQADLTKLVKDSDDLFVSEVKHKSFLDINEEGTEAAAATSIMIVEMSAIEGDEPFYMEVNRPFVLTINDDATGAILFTGVIYHPDES